MSEPTPGGNDSVEELATDYLSRMSAGEMVDLDMIRQKLASDVDVREFDELIEMVITAERQFPVAVSPGQILAGRYRLIEGLGAGGLGKVWLAHDEDADRSVAVKVLNLIGVDVLDADPSGMREARRLAEMNHPNIAGVRDVGTDGDLRFLVMDVVEGQSMARVLASVREAAGQVGVPRQGRALADAIGRGSPPGRADLIDHSSWVRSVAAIMIEAVRGLEAAHVAGVMHRDLRPENVMVTGGGHPVLLDFGLGGRTTGDLSSAAARLYGKASYMAPEQIDAESVDVDPRTDVYQMGLVLYEMLTLRRAFPGDADEALARIRQGEVLPPREVDPTIPSELEDICLMALEVIPLRRYGSAAAMQADLERFVGGCEMPLACRGRSGRLPRRLKFLMRRQGKPMLALLGILAAVVASYAYFDWAGPSDQIEVIAAGESGADVVVGMSEVAVRLSTTRVRHLFALEVQWDEKGRPVVLRPVKPQLQLKGRVEASEEWALRVDPGQHVVVIDGRESPPAIAPERSTILVFTCGENRDKLGLLERAWGDMAQEMRRIGRSDLPQSVAKSIFEMCLDGASSGLLPPAALSISFDEIVGAAALALDDADVERHGIDVPYK